MKTSTKIIAATVAGFSFGAAGMVFAAQGMGPGGHFGPGMGQGPVAQGQGPMALGPGMGMGRGGRMQGPVTAEAVGARLAQQKAELKITPAQETAWQAYEQVVRRQATARETRRTEMQARLQDPAAMAEFDHAAQRESMLKLSQAEFTERDAARQALLGVLTPEQKALADQRLIGGHGGRMAQRWQAR